MSRIDTILLSLFPGVCFRPIKYRTSETRPIGNEMKILISQNQIQLVNANQIAKIKAKTVNHLVSFIEAYTFGTW